MITQRPLKAHHVPDTNYGTLRYRWWVAFAALRQDSLALRHRQPESPGFLGPPGGMA